MGSFTQSPHGKIPTRVAWTTKLSNFCTFSVLLQVNNLGKKCSWEDMPSWCTTIREKTFRVKQTLCPNHTSVPMASTPCCLCPPKILHWRYLVGGKWKGPERRGWEAVSGYMRRKGINRSQMLESCCHCKEQQTHIKYGILPLNTWFFVSQSGYYKEIMTWVVAILFVCLFFWHYVL